MEERYGRYLVLEKQYDKKREKSFYHCRCDCGNEKWVRQDQLRAGLIVSCGCYHSEVSSRVAYRMGKSRIRHGETGTRLHTIWIHMRQRCYDSNYNKYKYWGGKGIKICKEWSLYETFRDWARINGYKDNLTIDRLDNSKDYSPENCRWATIFEQNRNRNFSNV